MIAEMEFDAARALLCARVSPVETERVALESAAGRVLAEDIRARENVPAFDRSPYDGYALRAADIAAASRDMPITLRVTEEIAAGSVPCAPVAAGCCAKILTGAPIPMGADCVEMFENTRFTAEDATFFAPRRAGENIIRAGEDVQMGALLARCGSAIDAGLSGTLAAQGIGAPTVYKRPRVALLSTGSELVEADEEPAPGTVRNSSRYMLTAAIEALGCEVCYLGIAPDREQAIAARLEEGLRGCDAVVTTGGVSVGDYDKTPVAMERVGCEILTRGVSLKPGGACCYGVRDGKPVAALSGNPASAMTNFYAIAASALRKRTGRADYEPPAIAVTLAADFAKKSRMTRLVRGTLALSEGRLLLHPAEKQGNVVVSSLIGAQAMAIVPAGSGALGKGTQLKGFLL